MIEQWAIIEYQEIQYWFNTYSMITERKNISASGYHKRVFGVRYATNKPNKGIKFCFIDILGQKFPNDKLVNICLFYHADEKFSNINNDLYRITTWLFLRTLRMKSYTSEQIFLTTSFHAHSETIS